MRIIEWKLTWLKDSILIFCFSFLRSYVSWTLWAGKSHCSDRVYLVGALQWSTHRDFFSFLVLPHFFTHYLGKYYHYTGDQVWALPSDPHVLLPQPFSFCWHLVFLSHCSQDVSKFYYEAENYFLGRMYCTDCLLFPNCLHRSLHPLSNGLWPIHGYMWPLAL